LLAYFCILSSAAVGYFSGPWWFGLVPGVGLAILGIAEHQKFRTRLSAVHATDVLVISGAASLANGLLTAGGAYLLGRVVAGCFVV